MKRRRPSGPQAKRPIAAWAQHPGAALQDYAARLNAALAMHRQGQLNQAEALYREILQSQPQHFDALQLLATLAAQRKNSAAAVELFDQALRIDPNHAGVLVNRGVALRDLQRFDEALESYDRALRIRPDDADALNNRGVTLRDLNRHAQALESYDRALRIKPDHADALNNRGNALVDLRRPDEALESYDRALRIKPGYAEAFNNLGRALRDLKRLDEALESYDHALRIRPDYVDALYNRGNASSALNRLAEALESYGRALKIKPDHEFLYGTWLHTKMKLCDWSDAQGQISELLVKIESNAKATPSFPVLALTDSLALQRKAAAIWVNDRCPPSLALPPLTKRARHEKIRIGYFSMDFRNHPVSFLTADLFEAHDRKQFEVYAFSFGPDTRDEMRSRLEAVFDRFIDVRNESDMEIAKLARAMEIDIAIDLGGLTADSRTGIFALRAAPLQVNYIGYPGTMAADYMDYLIADKQVVPESNTAFYSEKIAYLPCFQANHGKRKAAARMLARDEVGLPESGFVFCCFNSNYKIMPGTFDGWMRILKRVDGSVLLLDNELAAANLKKAARERGVDDHRLVFGKPISTAEYLARCRCADLFLDTFPFNAGTTASDALWMGLPVLTCMGAAFASRMAASLLNAVDLPELITTTQEQYEALAVELATNPERLRRIRQKLEQNRLTTPLFDTKLFTRHIEAAYLQMYERYQAGLPPEHIQVRAAT